MICFKVDFNQAFLKYAGNLATSAKLLASGMKCDTSERDYPKVVYEFSNSFTTALNTLCRPLPIIFSDSYAIFHALCIYLIRSCIFNITSLALMYGYIWLPP